MRDFDFEVKRQRAEFNRSTLFGWPKERIVRASRFSLNNVPSPLECEEILRALSHSVTCGPTLFEQPDDKE